MGTNTKVICTKSKIEDIADAVRLRNNTQSTFTLDTLATAVNELNNKYIITFTHATPNATITATKSGVSYSTISDSNGSGSITVYDYGTWIVVDVTTSKSTEVVFEKELSIIFSKIPAAYQEVEYIESTGTQFINTGILMQDGLEYEISFSTTQRSGSYSIAGDSGSWVGVFYLTNGPKYAICGKTGYGYYSSNSTTGIFHYKEPYYESTFNNVAVSSKNGDSYTYTGNLYLFKAYYYNQIPNLKLYYAKVWINNTVAYDLIPCYRKSDNVVGMYDIINNVFYTNAGTGTFVKGPDITQSHMKVY